MAPAGPEARHRRGLPMAIRKVGRGESTWRSTKGQEHGDSSGWGRGSAVAARQDIRDVERGLEVGAFAPESDGREHRVKKPPRAARRRPAARILVASRSLADDHHPRARPGPFRRKTRSRRSRRTRNARTTRRGRQRVEVPGPPASAFRLRHRIDGETGDPPRQAGRNCLFRLRRGSSSA